MTQFHRNRFLNHDTMVSVFALKRDDWFDFDESGLALDARYCI